jgi:hypothetical protein
VRKSNNCTKTQYYHLPLSSREPLVMMCAMGASGEERAKVERDAKVVRDAKVKQCEGPSWVMLKFNVFVYWLVGR